MPIPSTIADLSTTASLNSPAGSDNLSTTDDYLRAIQAIVKTQDNATAKLAGATFTGPINESRGTIAMHATTMDLWSQPNTIDGTGSAVTITAIANAPQAGAKRTLYPPAGTVITNGATFAVDGAANYTTAAGDALEFEAVTTSTYKVHITKKDGTAVVASGVDLTTNQTIAGVKTFSSQPIFPAQSMVRLNTANGYGSTNTKIRRFTNTVTNQGTDITYADSAANGASFTINTNGVYSISYSDNLNAATSVGLSLNSSQLTTDIASITAADRISYTTTASASYSQQCGVTMPFSAGDVIRAHTSGAASGANPVHFTITRVS